MNKTYAWTASLTIIIAFVAAAVFTDQYGRNSRSYDLATDIMVKDAVVHVVKTPNDLYYLWKKKGFAGREIVHVGRFFHFVSLEDADWFKSIDRAPLSTDILLARYEQQMTFRNYLWVAMQAGIARQIFTVLPPDVFKERSERGKNNSESTVTPGVGIQLATMGLKRTIYDRVPRLREPVLLVIDASYFTTPDAAIALAGWLGSSGLKADMVTLCLSEGSPDVTAVERARLKEYVQRFTPWIVQFEDK